MNAFTIDDAMLMAVVAHRGQPDRGRRALPYITHPMRVMTAFDDHDLQMIAILHDAVEDTPLTLEQIREAGAGERVLAGIAAMTHPKGQPDEEYWAVVRANPDALAVKRADIADNLLPARLALLTPAVAEKRRRKYARALEVLGITANREE